MARSATREALLEQGALLFGRHGVDGVTTRQLHEAAGARNESALHYHFGNREGLVAEIVRAHMAAVESRRAPLAAALEAEGRTGDLGALVAALAAPMAADLATPLGRAHLRLVARLSPPALAYHRPFRLIDAPAGRAVVEWIDAALGDLPHAVRVERMAILRTQLLALFGARAELCDARPELAAPARTELFLANLVDVVVGGLAAPVSSAARDAANG